MLVVQRQRRRVLVLLLLLRRRVQLALASHRCRIVAARMLWLHALLRFLATSRTLLVGILSHSHQSPQRNELPKRGQETLGPDHQGTLACFNNLASLLQEQGNTEEAPEGSQSRKFSKWDVLLISGS